ncbi:MAG: hypothetical protein ACXWYI_05140 [Actinomycetota bacterium]
MRASAFWASFRAAAWSVWSEASSVSSWIRRFSTSAARSASLWATASTNSSRSESSLSEDDPSRNSTLEAGPFMKACAARSFRRPVISS